MLPGKKYSPEDIVRLLVRRAWFLIVPVMLMTTLAVVMGQRLPKKYESETLIMVVPQRIPQSYVKEGGTENIEDRLATLRDQILSRSRLERIVVDLNLYPSLRSSLPMEDVIERMRGDISIETNISRATRRDDTQSASFKIRYVGANAKTVQKTTERLASLFIEENLQDRANVAESTTQFLESQLEDARRQLVDQEKKLEDYRRQYSGELPTQESSNMQAIQSLQVQLQTLSEATDRARERRILLERQMADLALPDPLGAVQAAAAQKGPVTLTTAQQLEKAKAQLQVLLLHDKPDHPDVRMTHRAIRDLEATLKAEAAAGSGAADPAVFGDPLKEKRRRDLTADLAAVDRELADKADQEKTMGQQLASYQAKLEAMPSRESDLVALTRDYATLQNTYQSLLAKREDAKLAANLERRNIGEQFRVLDPARMAERPISPNAMVIIAAGAGVGLLAGLALVGLLEYRDRSFATEAEVARLCQLPVLALVPELADEQACKTRQRRRLVLNAAGIVAVMALGATLFVLTRAGL